MSADLAVEVRIARLAPQDVYPHPRASVTEDELMRPAAQTTVWGDIVLERRCACGRSVAAPENPDLWADAVAAHNDTSEHRDWRLALGLTRRRIEL